MALIHLSRMARHAQPRQVALRFSSALQSQHASSRLYHHRSALTPQSRTITQSRPTLKPRTTLQSQSERQRRTFSSTPAPQATFNQVLRGCRKPRKTKVGRSPVLSVEKRPEIQGVCLRVGITKPKKPNSGERKTARVRLSNGKEVNAYIGGQGHNIQQHSVVLLRGGRAQDCPGVKYRCIRGHGDLGGVPNRLTSRSKFGTKKPKTSAPPS